jgi:hypothetical protein
MEYDLSFYYMEYNLNYLEKGRLPNCLAAIAALYLAMLVGWSVGQSIRPAVGSNKFKGSV